MHELPRVPKDLEAINKLRRNLSKEDLELLNCMDEYSREWFFDSIQYEIQTRKEESKAERIQAIKFFFTVVGVCALAAVLRLNFPTNVVFTLIYLYAGLSLLAIVGNFIAIPIRAIKSAIQKSEFSLKQHLLSDTVYMDGMYLVTLFVLALNDL